MELFNHNPGLYDFGLQVDNFLCPENAE